MRFTTKLLPSRSGNLGIIQLNNPKALHALTLDMIHAFQDVLAAYETDDTLRAILVKSTPSAKRPAFCAGGDVKAVYDAGMTYDAEARAEARAKALPGKITPIVLPTGKGLPGYITSDFFRYEYQLNYSIYTCTKPYISLWDGIVMGGGVGISIHGTYRVATDRTVFSMPETALGLFPDVGSTFWMPQKLAKFPGMCQYLALTGKQLLPSDLLYTGLATHYVPSSRLDELEKALVDATNDQNNQHNITTTTTTTTTATPEEEDVVVKPVLDSFHVTPQFPEPQDSFLAQFEEEIEQIFSMAQSKSVEEIVEKLKSRQQASKFAKDTLTTLLRMSPTSLKLTHDVMFPLCNTMKDCLQTEFRMVQNILQKPPKDSDFYEGVRAILIDKDQSPKWKPDTLQEVTPEMVIRHFYPMPDPDHEWEPAPKTTTTTTAPSNPSSNL